MPPTSSRAASPLARSEHRSDTSPSYLTALRDLENPVSSDVLHLADTLTTTSSEDDILAENLRFLRSPASDPQEEWRAENARQHPPRTVLEERAQERERRERIDRAISRLRRQEHPAAYGDRTPSENLLYGWAPPASNESRDEVELRQLLAELRQQQPNMNPEILRTLGRAQLESERQSQSRAYHSSSRLSTLAHSSHSSSESSLRATAIAQSVRRHPRFSDRTRLYMQRSLAERASSEASERLYMQRSLAERENAPRSGNSSSEATELRELRERFSPRSPGVSVREPSRYEHHRRNWLAEQQNASGDSTSLSDRSRYEQHNTPSDPSSASYRNRYELYNTSSDVPSANNRSRVLGRDIRRNDAYRRSYLENPSQTVPTSSTPSLEQTIEYMSRLRSSTCYEDSLRSAIETGFATKKFLGVDNDDFLLDLNDIPPPAETSWLRPGAVLSGSQHATSMPAGISAANHIPNSQTSSLNRSTNTHPTSSPYYTTASPWGPRDSYIPPHARRASDLPSPVPTAHQDRWPVKVTIHAVDLTKMQLSATMEAYNVPSQPPVVVGALNHHPPSPAPRTSSITTYLEGEILDFRAHGFLTESFAADPHIDALYWRKLLPFVNLDRAALVHALTSKAALRRLAEEYVFMRWKERCFVKGTGSVSYPAGTASASAATASSASSAAAHGWHDAEYAAEDSCGLTISGFYYVCLRRSDGAVEGLYHDPQSSPYQHLKLESVQGGLWPKYEFR